MTNWRIFQGTRRPHMDKNIGEQLGDPPNWRSFKGKHIIERDIPPENEFERRYGRDKNIELGFDKEFIDLINAALFLRRPLFIVGKPGCGKSSVAYAIAHELHLGKVLKWPITSRSTLSEGLYHYDAIGRLQNTKEGKDAEITQYLRLGPLGTALLPAKKPRILLIDEIDKSDINLPNDLLNLFEEGEFNIPEIARLPQKEEPILVLPSDSNDPVNLKFDKDEQGKIKCYEFPFIIMTSNEEKDFPPAFLRRCLRYRMEPPKGEKLKNIVEAHLGSEKLNDAEILFKQFEKERNSKDLSIDQLLNALYIMTRGVDFSEIEYKQLLETLFKPLSND